MFGLAKYMAVQTTVDYPNEFSSLTKLEDQRQKTKYAALAIFALNSFTDLTFAVHGHFTRKTVMFMVCHFYSFPPPLF